MQFKKQLLFLTLILLLIGIVSANEVVDNSACVDSTDNGADSVENINTGIVHSVDSMSTDDIVSNNICGTSDEITNPIRNKKVEKEIGNKTLKTTSNSYNITSFDSLYQALTSDTYDIVTVDLSSDIVLKDEIDLNEAIGKLTINGNGKVIDGDNGYSFLFINENSNVMINNLIIKNCMGYAITNWGNLTITNSVFDNNNGVSYIEQDGEVYPVAKSSDGSIHNYDAKLNIDNSTFKNSLCLLGSSISAYESYVDIKNSDFINNTAISAGGAIYLSDSTINVTKSKFINNSGSGGAIRPYWSIVKIIDSEFVNNSAKDDGGAIFNWQSDLNITGSSFKNNKALANYSTGGAISNYEGFVNITKSVFDDNSAANGGAIANIYGDLNITNSIITNNKADAKGGAIINKGDFITYSVTHMDAWGRPSYTTYHEDIYGSLISNKNLFINNTATEGGAICTNITTHIGARSTKFEGRNDVGVEITEDKFINNTASTYGGAITVLAGSKNYIVLNLFSKNKADTGQAIISNGNDTIENNINDTTIVFNSIYTYSKTISTISYNTFEDKFSTIITLNKINSVYNGENVSITGKIMDETQTPLQNVWVQISNNNNIISAKTNNNGEFTQNIKTNKLGLNNITVKYAGNKYYNESTSKATYTTTAKPTKITFDAIKNVAWGDTVTVTGKLKDNKNNPIQSSVSININGKTFAVKTDKNGQFRVTAKTSKPMAGKIIATFNNNEYYLTSNNTATYEVTARKTQITINTINSVSWGNTVTITGTFKDEKGVLFKNTAVQASVNGGKLFRLKTDKNGVFTITTKTNKPMTGKVTVQFAGNSYYKQTNADSTYKVIARNTQFTITAPKTAIYGSDMKITGKFMDEKGNIFKNSAVTAKLNGKTFKVKTDANGMFTINAKANTINTNTITMTFSGNNYYKESTGKTTFTVNQAQTKILINKIPNTKKGSSLTITGTFKDQNNNKIVNSALKVNLNGKTFNVKTDNKATYKITTKTNKIGTNNITVSYPGSTYYKSSTNKATYTVIK